jgi:hypothetical protein
MTQQELLERVRRRLRDNVGTADELLFEDDELIDDYANAARDRLFLTCRNLIIDSTTPTDGGVPLDLPLCRIAVEVGVSQYQTSPKVIEIERVKLATQFLPMTRVMQNQLDLLCFNWQNADPNTPWAWCPDLNTDTITFIPTPKVADTAILTVSRFPLVRLSLSDKTIPLGFREEYHEDLIPWILYLAFSKQDVETQRPELAEYYRKLFLDRCQDIKMEVHRRLSGPHTNVVRRAFGSR